MVTTSVAKLYLDEHNIVHMEFINQGGAVNLANAKEILVARLALYSLEKKHLLFVDLRSNPKPSIEARSFSKSPEVNDTCVAMAMIIDGPFSRLLGNFFLGFNKGAYPVKLFTCEKLATEWLLSHRVAIENFKENSKCPN